MYYERIGTRFFRPVTDVSEVKVDYLGYKYVTGTDAEGRYARFDPQKIIKSDPADMKLFVGKTLYVKAA